MSNLEVSSSIWLGVASLEISISPTRALFLLAMHGQHGGCPSEDSRATRETSASFCSSQMEKIRSVAAAVSSSSSSEPPPQGVLLRLSVLPRHTLQKTTSRLAQHNHPGPLWPQAVACMRPHSSCMISYDLAELRTGAAGLLARARAASSTAEARQLIEAPLDMDFIERRALNRNPI
jgi:hypothetical protein